MAFPLLLTMIVGVSIRVWFFRSSALDWLASKNEISSPLTSWKRVTEGLALHRLGISPYSGDLYHEMPFMLRLHKSLNNFWGPAINMCYVFLDLILAIILERIAKHFGRYLLMKQTKEVKNYSPKSMKLLLNTDQLSLTRLYVVAIYLLNPYSVACCVARSTAVFNNIMLALSILYTIKGSRTFAAIFIALASYISMYPIMLVVPATIAIEQKELKDKVPTLKQTLMSIFHMFTMTGMVLGTLLYGSFIIEGSWKFMESTYGFILTVPDLTPNMGVFWYFFTEMFEHFRIFFICVFQINVFIYTVPLAVRLRDDPMFMMYIMVALMAIFKSYPTYADPALYLAMLPLWKHCFPYMRNNFIVTCMMVTCTVLGAILWHLWIYAGSANANFYFAITLVYSTAHIFLVTDLLFAYLRRDYDLIHGPEITYDDGKPAKIILD